MKKCRDCGETKPTGDYYKSNPSCKPCLYKRQRVYVEANREKVREWQRAWAKRNPDHSRKMRLRRYGMTPESFDALLAAQGGICAICDRDEPGGKGQWHIDHDHACCPEQEKSCGECVRGLLCQRCNMALGLFSDDITMLNRAADYLAGKRVSL